MEGIILICNSPSSRGYAIPVVVNNRGHTEYVGRPIGYDSQITYLNEFHRSTGYTFNRYPSYVITISDKEYNERFLKLSRTSIGRI